MKNYFFGLIATVLLLTTGLSSAQTNEKAAWPYGCRKHTVNVGFYSTELLLCCTPTNWRFPPISCVEMENNNRASSNVFYQYVMLSEIEKNIGKSINEISIIVFSDKDLVEEDSSYKLTRKDYPIETNDLKERFIKLEFIKN